MRSRCAAFVAALFATLSAHGGDSPMLGQPIDEAAVDSITVYADGRGLPSGQGTGEQGEEIYNVQCIACHGGEGEAGLNDQLAGGELPYKRTIGTYWPYAPTVFDYVRRAMPYHGAGQLNDDETYAVVAYLLYLNDIVDDDDVIDAAALSAIEMPARKIFFSRFPIPE